VPKKKAYSDNQTAEKDGNEEGVPQASPAAIIVIPREAN